MKFRISNLAHVKNAVYEEKDLTVIVGDNGTGKTLFLETKTLISNYYSVKIDNIISTFLFKDNNLIECELNIDEVVNSLENPIYNKNHVSSKLKSFPVKIKFHELDKITNYFINEINAIKKEVIMEINKEILFVEKSDLGFEFLDLPNIKEEYSAYLKLSYIQEDEILLQLSVVKENGKEERISSRLIIDNKLDMFLLAESIEEYNNIEHMKENSVKKTTEELIINKIKSMILESIYKLYFQKGTTLFLPSERNLYMDNAMRNTLDQIEKSKFEELFKTNRLELRYSEHLFNLAYLKFKNIFERHPQFADKLIKNQIKELEILFGGTLSFGERGEVESITKNDGSLIKRELFSTKQNRLIPYLIMFNPFQRYSKIIIEEPEAHLSLKSMNELLGFIATLIKSGHSIVITTHSDVFFARVNNLLLVNQDIGSSVFEFKTVEGFSELEQKEKTDYGYEIDLFSKELDDLYEETLEIQKGTHKDE